MIEKSRYTYVGEVELADDPYMSDQPDTRAQDRFVWIFPLRKKKIAQSRLGPTSAATTDYLPHGAYAVIRSDLTDAQRALVDEALDKLKEAEVPVFDRRDVDRHRYERALAQWHEAVLDRVRAKVRELIAAGKRAAKAAGREFTLVDDELRVSSASSEAELRAALALLDYDEPIAQAQLFEEARQAIPLPDPPDSLSDSDLGEPEKTERTANRDRNWFADFT